MSWFSKFTRKVKKIIPKKGWRIIRDAIDAVAISHGIPAKQIRSQSRTIRNRLSGLQKLSIGELPDAFDSIGSEFKSIGSVFRKRISKDDLRNKLSQSGR